MDSSQTQENYREYLKPEFRSTASSFFIVLKILITWVAINSGDNNIIKVKEEQKEEILNFASKKKLFKTSEIETLLNVKSSRARLLISELVAEEKLISIGANRNKRYKLK